MLQQLKLCLSNGNRNIEEKPLQEGSAAEFLKQQMYLLQLLKFLTAVQLSPGIYGAQLIIYCQGSRLRELEKLCGAIFKPVQPHHSLAELDDEELNVLFLLASGMTRKMASGLLDIPEGTFKKYCTNIYKVLGVSSIVELVKRSEQEHWFSL